MITNFEVAQNNNMKHVSDVVGDGDDEPRELNEKYL